MSAVNPRLSYLAIALMLGACGNSPGPIFEPDAGRDAGPEPDAGTDAGDTEAPRVVGTTPAHGAMDVAVGAEIVVEFSEPMDESAGDVRIEADGAVIAATESWNDAGTELTLTPDEPLPSGGRVRVTVSAGFADRAGNSLGVPTVFVFDVADVDPPRVLSASPGEGAVDVPGRLDAIEIVFDQAMSATGTLRIEGGPGTVGTPVWSTASVRFPVAGLAYDTEYHVVLEGFTDAAGNALDGAPYLGDGALDFTTAPDTDGPRVVSSNPDEGQVNVSLRFVESIVIELDEPMDTTVTEADLALPGTVRTLSGTWSSDARTITFPVAGALGPDGAHSLDLRGLRDAAGNALEGSVHLYDGRLDFVTGADDVVPRVVFATPEEGSSDATFRQTFLRLVFNQAMDTSITSLPFDDGSGPVELTGTWNLAGTRLTFDVTDMIFAGRTYRLDATEMLDATGRPLDVAHEYLGDGVLDFTTVTPNGESCRDALRASEATSITPTGGLVYEIGERQVFEDDGSAPCDTNGIPADAVIHYVKTSPAGGTSGGRWLRIRAEDPAGGQVTSARINLDLYRGSCDPLAASASEAQEHCLFDRSVWQVLIPAPPDDYFIWVSHQEGATFRPIRVTIEEEMQGPAEGDSCQTPFTTATAAPIYTPPSAESPFHVWDLPSGAAELYTYGRTNRGDDVMECDPDGRQGVDAIIRFDKSSADSVLDVSVETFFTLGNGLNFQILDGCDPQASTSLACFGHVRYGSGVDPARRRTWLRGDAGPLYFWVSEAQSYYDSIPARVLIREVPPSPGVDCRNAIPITPGSTVPVEPVDTRLFPPSCMPAQSNVTWYRVTASQRALLVSGTPTDPEVPGAFALIDPETESELSCVADIEGTFRSAFLEVGDDICVAVESGRVASLTVEAVPYNGLTGTPVDLGIELAQTSTGSSRSIGSSNWLAITPTTLYAGVGLGGTTSSHFVFYAQRTGGAPGQALEPYPANVGGYTAVAVGEALFAVDDLAMAGTTARLNRIVDSTGSYGPIAWDSGTSYPAWSIRAMTYDGTDLWLVAHATTTSHATRVWRASPSGAGPLTLVGDIPGIDRVAAITNDGTWMYLAAGNATTGAVYRIRMADIGDGVTTPELLGSLALPTTSTEMVLDDPANPANLYVRGNAGVSVVTDPAGPAPRYLGVLYPQSGGGRPMARDPVTGHLILIEHASPNRIVRLD